MRSGVVELKDKSAALQVRDANFATGELAIGADADGRILVRHVSGRITICPIGYVTNGEDEPHRFDIDHGNCTWRSNG
jgi:hypothetical protein